MQDATSHVHSIMQDATSHVHSTALVSVTFRHRHMILRPPHPFKHIKEQQGCAFVTEGLSDEGLPAIIVGKGP